jgi:phosphohistidine phosphatase SixA
MRFSSLAGRRSWSLAVVLLAQACATPYGARVGSVVAAGTTVVVVRHAEKSTDDPKDPSLSAAGEQRARDLSVALTDAGVTEVYVTQYKRTRQTAEPLARAAGISIVERPINAANSATYANDLAHEILTKSAGKSVLVVGHSNTVPDIVKALSGSTVPPISDAEYDHIFVVTIPPAGSPRVMQVRFGVALQSLR